MLVHQDSYIKTEKPSKISNITFAILPFYQKNIQTERPFLVLWNLLLLMKPIDVLQMGQFKILMDLVYVMCVTNAQRIPLILILIPSLIEI